ncbi:CapA family protein [Ramlibacter sp. G-1-2-2]|uniref:CapA family protein n=1 Tax=Ramlibacter agri TaxID=2728837 RepID=A0A848H265_9BURK|nr:CapA family protein [Ramlibacter agri]NML42813.1 CapA family protein [Ramlibacter agri]
MASQGLNWNVALVGECMVSRPFAVHDDAESMRVINMLRGADLTYAHLEMNFAHQSELEYPGRGDWLGSFMMADPQIARDLRWAGVDIMSHAQNHSMDFGPAGMLATLKHCREAGIAIAGTGADLEAAREPQYLETKQGRVAIVSTSSGNKPNEWASLGKGGYAGRPGINPLRAGFKYMLTQEAAEQMRAIALSLDVLREADGSTMGTGLKAGEFSFQMPGDQSTRGSNVFIPGDKFEIQSFCHKGDLEGNLRSIDEARKMADFVVVAHHFNIADGKRREKVPMFAREFAHAAIDAGADVYIAHGWHWTLGIEVYKGKPIIYGTGNFFAQSEFIQRVPYDSYESWGHDMNRLPTLNPADHPLHPGLDKHNENWWTSALMALEMKGGKFVRMNLHPVEMGRTAREGTITRRTGQGEHKLTEGRPLISSGETAQRTLDRIARLSKNFGTEVSVEDGIGVIRF